MHVTHQQTSTVETFRVSLSKTILTFFNKGAKPRVWAAAETNRPDFHNTFDVMGAGPRMLHFELNKPEYNLTNKDIKGTEPCVNQFKSTRTQEPSNPLNPRYNL